MVSGEIHPDRLTARADIPGLLGLACSRIQAAHSSERRDLGRRLEEFFARHADPKYDLWKGGASKVRRLLRGS